MITSSKQSHFLLLCFLLCKKSWIKMMLILIYYILSWSYLFYTLRNNALHGFKSLCQILALFICWGMELVCKAVEGRLEDVLEMLREIGADLFCFFLCMGFGEFSTNVLHALNYYTFHYLLPHLLPEQNAPTTMGSDHGYLLTGLFCATIPAHEGVILLHPPKTAQQDVRGGHFSLPVVMIETRVQFLDWR